MPELRKGKLESIVVTSTVGIGRLQFGAAQVTGAATAPLTGARNSEPFFTRGFFDLRQNLFHLVPAESTQGMALDVTERADLKHERAHGLVIRCIEDHDSNRMRPLSRIPLRLSFPFSRPPPSRHRPV